MKDLNINLLRKRERDERVDEISKQEFLLKHPKVEDKAQVRKNIEKAQSQLTHLSPEPLTPMERDKLARMEKQLAEKIVQGMPTEEVMRKNPVGAVDQHGAWERANKKLIKWWKNVRIQLNPDSDDKDLANVERLRPSGQLDRMRTDAQIPGLMSYGNISEEQWPFESPKDTALEQAKRAEAERQARIAKTILEVEQTVSESPATPASDVKHTMSDSSVPRGNDGVKRTMTPERKKQLQAALERARAVRRAKQSAVPATATPEAPAQENQLVGAVTSEAR